MPVYTPSNVWGPSPRPKSGHQPYGGGFECAPIAVWWRPIKQYQCCRQHQQLLLACGIFAAQQRIYLPEPGQELKRQMCPNWCCRAKASQAAQHQTSKCGPKCEGQAYISTFLTIVTGHELGWPVKRLLWDFCPAMNISPTPFLVYWPSFLLLILWWETQQSSWPLKGAAILGKCCKKILN